MADYAELSHLGSEISAAVFKPRLRELLEVERPRADLRWRYYRNPLTIGAAAAGREARQSDESRGYTLGQEWGMPLRVTGYLPGGGGRDATIDRKEVVVQNEIGWRVRTKVEYLAGKPVLVSSAAPVDDARRRDLTAVIRGFLAANGGMLYWQWVCLLGEVFGFGDFLVEPRAPGSASEVRLPPLTGGSGADAPIGFADMGDEPPAGQLDRAAAGREAKLRAVGASIRMHLIERSRVLPILDAADWRRTLAYAQVYDGAAQRVVTQPRSAMIAAIGRALGWSANETFRAPLLVDVVGEKLWQRYRDGVLEAEEANPLGVVPVVHYSPDPEPFVYAGPGSVELLIALQDELNCRMSDRGWRLTTTAFKMYLMKGVADFGSVRVGPGRMFGADSTSADVQAFGGDPGSLSEDEHLSTILEALDKQSGVSPIAAGALKGRIGQLTSANALRMTLMSLLSQTVSKRSSLGMSIQESIELMFAWLDKTGAFATQPEERRVALSWPSPLPENLLERLSEGELKERLGVPQAVVLAELGYRVDPTQGKADGKGGESGGGGGGGGATSSGGVGAIARATPPNTGTAS